MIGIPTTFLLWWYAPLSLKHCQSQALQITEYFVYIRLAVSTVYAMSSRAHVNCSKYVKLKASVIYHNYYFNNTEGHDRQY